MVSKRLYPEQMLKFSKRKGEAEMVCRKRRSAGFALHFLLLISTAAFAVDSEIPRPSMAPPTELTAVDNPNDAGNAINLEWKLSLKDQSLWESSFFGIPWMAVRNSLVAFLGFEPVQDGFVTAYHVFRSESIDGLFILIAKLPAGTVSFQDASASEAPPEEGAILVEKKPEEPLPEPKKPDLIPGKIYYYRVDGINNSGESFQSDIAGPVKSIAQWYHTGKTPVLVFTLVFFVMLIYYIQVARRKGASMYVRPIAGMSEIDNAIGRATEMGRPILYVLGLGDPQDIATIASYTILARVAKKTAEYRTSLIVPCNEPIVMTIAQETVKNAYLEAGHPDAYSDNMVFFVTSMQFAYVAAVNGLMLREKTATNCYFGKFYAESLLLSEAGNIAGSIQVAGTDEVAQLPFFVTTCDYTLIGEELYAASAYLGRDPLLLGALKAQDFAKAIVMILIALGAILITINQDWDWILKLVTINL
jgi:hypothetical protein